MQLNLDPSVDLATARFQYLKTNVLVRQEEFGGSLYLLDKNVNFCVNPDTYQVLDLIKGSATLAEFVAQGSERGWLTSIREASALLESVYRALQDRVYNGDVAPGNAESIANNEFDGSVFATGRLSSPLRLIVELSFRRDCNLDCKFCYADADFDKHVGPLLSTEDLFKIADSAKAAHVLYCQLMGGEPLIRRDFARVLHYFVDSGIAIGITTNGLLLHRFVKDFQDARRTGLLCPIEVSMHGPDRVTYHNTTGNPPQVFDAVERNLRVLHDAGIPTGLKSVVTRKNWPDLPRLFQFADDHGSTTLTLLHLLAIGGGKEMKDLTHFDEASRVAVRTAIAEARARYEFYIDDRALRNIWTPKTPTTPLESYVDCPSGSLDMRIRADGRIIQCSAVREELFNLQTTSLQTAWDKFNQEKQPCPFRFPAC